MESVELFWLDSFDSPRNAKFKKLALLSKFFVIIGVNWWKSSGKIGVNFGAKQG